jgi:hypothetical protein
MKFNILPSRVIKTKSFCPNPLVKHGIPAYADAIANPKVADTLAYQQFWEEQLHYMHYGYQTGGLYLPGRFYKFINLDKTQTVKGNVPMEYHDYQLDYALWIEDLKKRRKNAFIPKARRKALSVMTNGMVIDYGWRFSQNYHAAVVAGLDEHAQDFMDKWRFINSNMIPEFRVRMRYDNADEIVAGWQEMTATGPVDNGTMNTVYIRTVNKNPNVLKGKFLHDIVSEESGENEMLLEMQKASEMCLRLGGVQFGTFWFYGTGGNMDKGSKDFKHLSNNLDAYNAEEWCVLAPVFYYPAYAGATDERGVVSEDVPNLQHLEPYQRFGISDEVRAEQLIKEEKKKLLDEGDMDKYFKFEQENPLERKEIFRKTASNNFDVVKMNDQLYKIDTEGSKRYNRWVLDYKKNPETGALLIPTQIEIKPASKETPEDQVVYILNDGHPVQGYVNLDVAGIDSYDQNQSKNSKSLGAMVVFRKKHNIAGQDGWRPVALIRTRPKYKEQFYEMCLKLSIYYGIRDNVLCDARTPLIMKHFQDAGFEWLLARRPRKFESVSAKASNEFGLSLNTSTKPKMIAALQSFFDFHVEKVWFEEIINEALNYDEFEVDSDNDSVDALGLALMQAISADNYIPANESEIMQNDPYEYPEFSSDSEGNSIVVPSKIANEKPIGVEEDYFSRYARTVMHSVDAKETSSSEDDFVPFDY